MSNIVQLSEVTKTYHRGSEIVRALDSVSLSVAAREFISIVGPSGSGKTTLLNLIGCVDIPNSGSVQIDAEETNRLNERALTKIRSSKIGFVFQQFFLLPTLTVLENVQLPSLFLSNGAAAARNRAAELLNRVSLSPRASHLPSQLSGGEMQRVAIARALINQPKILLADEPTGNLDSENAESILTIFRELNSSGLTILMVTHNTELAQQAGRIIHLKDGRIVT